MLRKHTILNKLRYIQFQPHVVDTATYAKRKRDNE